MCIIKAAEIMSEYEPLIIFISNKIKLKIYLIKLNNTLVC